MFKTSDISDGSDLEAQEDSRERHAPFVQSSNVWEYEPVHGLIEVCAQVQSPCLFLCYIDVGACIHARIICSKQHASILPSTPSTDASRDQLLFSAEEVITVSVFTNKMCKCQMYTLYCAYLCWCPATGERHCSRHWVLQPGRHGSFKWKGSVGP
jgi:hypothetical protein